MKASETSIQDLLEGTKQYVIPLFQRVYSWEKKDWETLWDDLMYLYELDVPRHHFIGSIVTSQATSVPEGVNKFLLIDGQQRITTIFILLASIRNHAISVRNDTLTAELENTLLFNAYKEGIDYYKLLPTQGDREAFEKIVRNQEKIAGSRMTDAYLFFERKLREKNPDLVKLKSLVTQRLSTVSIVLGQDDNPHLVFESLNAKGKPLTQSDLIRNYFMMKVPVGDQDSIFNEYWKPMQEGLGDNLSEFVRHYLMKKGTEVRKNEVYFILKETGEGKNAVEYLANLATFSKYYMFVTTPQTEEDKEVRTLLSWLNRFEISTAYPFFLNCYELISQNRLTKTEFSEILRYIKNYLIRRFVCGYPTNQLNKIFPPLYNQILKEQAASSVGFVDAFKRVLQTKNYPKDNEFIERLRDAKLYGAGDRTKKTKLLLESIEESFEHHEQVPFETLTVEHVMPQTLTDEWKQILGEGWEETYDLYLHTIGNLTLTGYNAELTNGPFEEKKKLLQESHLELNKYFLDKTTWNKSAIIARTESIRDIFLQLWPYFGSPDVGAADTSKYMSPKKLVMLGQEIHVSSWRDVLEKTMNILSDLEPEKFEQIVSEFPRYINKDKSKLRSVRQLDSGYFIEVNLSAEAIKRLCYQAIDSVGLFQEDWRIEFE